MAKIGKSLQELAIEIERRANAKKDFIAPVGRLEMQPSFDTASGVALVVQNGENRKFNVNELTNGQIAEYTGIPMPYYRRMLTSDPTLLSTNVNRWLKGKEQDRRMVRTLDGTARAFLSDRFRPLENEELAEAVLPVLLDQDLMVISSEITERRLYIKAVDRRIERDVPTGRKMGDGTHVFFDTVSPAITISNSEVGAGALSIETGVYTKVCTNLAMIGTNLRRYHTGARAAISDEVYALLTDQTKRATDAAVWLQVRDLVKSAFELAKFDAMIKKLGDAAEQKIEDDPVQVIEKVGKRFNLLEGERTSVLRQLIEGADLSKYGIHAAITRASQDVDSYDRATELERIGGDVIELAPNEWRELAVAA